MALPALLKAWRQAEYEELWVQFRPRGGGDVVRQVENAVRAANRSVEEAGWGEGVFTGPVSDSEEGPVAYMSRAGPKDRVVAWLHSFAAHLEAAGLSGRVTAAPQAHFPMWLSDWTHRPLQLTAFVSYRTIDLALVDEQQRRAGWNVEEELTATIAAAAVAWGRFDGADTYFRSNIHEMRTRELDLTSPLASSITRFGMAGVTYLRSEPIRITSASLDAAGKACYQVWDEEQSWQDRLQQVADVMVALPEATDLAFVQYSNALTIAWDALNSGRPPLPHIREYQVRYNRHLDAHFVPDARGIQLLTDSHLARASDLTDWLFEPLGGGKHLVQAKDLEPWFASPDPPPDVLAKARADFGGMILTPEVIAANPPPWG